MNIEELAPDVCPAGDFGDPLAVEPAEPGIAIGVEIAPERPQVLGRALGLAVGCVAEQHGGRGVAASPTLVANIGPQPAGPGAPRTRGEHGHRRVVSVESGAAHDVALECVDQRT